MRRAAMLVMIGLASSGCGGASSTAPAPTDGHAARAPETLTFRATVRVEPSDPRHGLLLAILEADDGVRWLATYQADALWKELADRHVTVTGERYEPEGQALMMPHIRVATVHVLSPTAEDSIVEVGLERTFRGKFGVSTWLEGTKLAGESAPRFFDDDGKAYPLANAPEARTPHGKAVVVRGRLVTPSPFRAHEGGPFLWVFEVTPLAP